MCKSVKDGKKCKNYCSHVNAKKEEECKKERKIEKVCGFAHNPTQLELVKLDSKKKNLEAVKTSLESKATKNKAPPNWVPPSDGGIEDRKFEFEFDNLY